MTMICAIERGDLRSHITSSGGRLRNGVLRMPGEKALDILDRRLHDTIDSLTRVEGAVRRYDNVRHVQQNVVRYEVSQIMLTRKD